MRSVYLGGQVGKKSRFESLLNRPRFSLVFVLYCMRWGGFSKSGGLRGSGRGDNCRVWVVERI